MSSLESRDEKPVDPDSSNTIPEASSSLADSRTPGNSACVPGDFPGELRVPRSGPVSFHRRERIKYRRKQPTSLSPNMERKKKRCSEQFKLQILNWCSSVRSFARLHVDHSLPIPWSRGTSSNQECCSWSAQSFLRRESSVFSKFVFPPRRLARRSKLFFFSL